jgi:hypothetical protein
VNAENAADDNKLRFIEQVEHRLHVIKIARRGNLIKLLIYPPRALLATRMIVDALSNYEDALQNAKIAINQMIRDRAAD